MENSSVPFRAFFGAILSVVKGEVVEASVFDSSIEFDIIGEEEEEESQPAPDADSSENIEIVLIKSQPAQIQSLVNVPAMLSMRRLY